MREEREREWEEEVGREREKERFGRRCVYYSTPLLSTVSNGSNTSSWLSYCPPSLEPVSFYWANTIRLGSFSCLLKWHARLYTSRGSRARAPISCGVPVISSSSSPPSRRRSTSLASIVIFSRTVFTYLRARFHRAVHNNAR